MLLGALIGSMTGVVVAGPRLGYMMGLIGMVIGGITLGYFGAEAGTHDRTLKSTRNSLLGMLVGGLTGFTIGAIAGDLRRRSYSGCLGY